MEVIALTPEREAEIVTGLRAIVEAFAPTEQEPELTMFGLISRYNATHPNPELIGGDWALAHGFDLPC